MCGLGVNVDYLHVRSALQVQDLGAVHKCQHLPVRTKRTNLRTPVSLTELIL